MSLVWEAGHSHCGFPRNPPRAWPGSAVLLSIRHTAKAWPGPFGWECVGPVCGREGLAYVLLIFALWPWASHCASGGLRALTSRAGAIILAIPASWLVVRPRNRSRMVTCYANVKWQLQTILLASWEDVQWEKWGLEPPGERRRLRAFQGHKGLSPSQHQAGTCLLGAAFAWFGVLLTFAQP